MASSATNTPSTTGSNNSNSPSQQAAVDEKIMKDLDVLTEKMDLCDSMLRPGGGDPAPSVRKDEALLQVIGFLEACAPRMVELVEAAAVGALSEHVLMKCLEVNDRLTKSLADIDTVALTETPASTTAAAAPPAAAAGGDLLLSDDSTGSASAAAPPVGGGKSTGEDEIPATKSDDAFDSFFNERQGAGN